MRETSNSLPSTIKKIQAFSRNDRIDHHVFGLGTIVEIDKWRTTIAFDESGTRKFVTSMVKLVQSDVPAPAKPVRRKKKASRSS